MRKCNESFLIISKKQSSWNINKLSKPSLLSRKPTNKSSGRSKNTTETQTNRSLTPTIPSLSFVPKPSPNSLTPPKEIFVLLNGSQFQSHSSHGFFHPIPPLQNSNLNHSVEMQIFFKSCSNFFKTHEPIQFLFSYKGSRLTCLHEVPENSKIVIVSSFSKYLGILTSIPSNPSFPAESIISLSKRENNSLLSTRINSQLIRRFSPSPERMSIEKSGRIKKRYEAKGERLKNVKDNTSYVLRQIEKCYPAITDMKMKQMKERLGLSEVKIHKFAAKFKTLVLISCTVNPEHKMEEGIDKEVFVEYQSCSKEQAFVLRRIFGDRESISWDEFFGTISVVEIGENDEKIDLIFRVYDEEKNGVLRFKQIRELCKVQLEGKGGDLLIDELSEYFALVIFDVVGVGYEMGIGKERIKEIVIKKGEKNLMEIFCKFKFLRF